MSERRRIHEKHDLSKTRRCELLMWHAQARTTVASRSAGPCCDATLFDGSGRSTEPADA